MHSRLMIVAVAASLLAACGGDASEEGAVTGGGEVLEGTASDAMLPLATVTSQPPLAPPEPDTSARLAGPVPSTEPSPVPAPTPTAEPSVTDTTPD